MTYANGYPVEWVTRDGITPIEPHEITIKLGEDGYPGAGWDYYLTTWDTVAAVPRPANGPGCIPSRWGDRGYLASAVFGWARDRFTLTAAGRAWLGIPSSERAQ